MFSGGLSQFGFQRFKSLPLANALGAAVLCAGAPDEPVPAPQSALLGGDRLTGTQRILQELGLAGCINNANAGKRSRQFGCPDH